ncbi:MAG TPA: DsbC family protein [Burkholderiales bacterium]
MSRIYALITLCITLLLPAFGHASEASVRQAFLARFPGATIEGITRMPVGGLYEVVFEGQIVYTDEKVTYIMSGNLFDLRGSTERNVTRERAMQLAAQTLAKSQDGAIKRVKGNGKRVLYTFEDPNCGYCKELQKELVKVNDVTIYTFLWPILSPDSVDKSKAIWCSKDRVRAWDEAMTKGTTAGAARKDCDTPLEKNAQLAQRFGIRGTPAIYLANGQQIGGYVPADKIEQALNTPSR